MALRHHAPQFPRAVRYAPVMRRASLSRRGFAFGVAVMLLLVAGGGATVWLHFRIHDLRLQQALLQSHALELEQDRLRLTHAVERLADPARLRAIARTELGLVDLGAPDANSKVLVEQAPPVMDRPEFFRKADPILGEAKPSRVIMAAVDLLGATEAVAAPLSPARKPRP